MVRLLDRAGAEETCRALLHEADVIVNGSRPWDIRVRDPRVYHRVLSQGSLGFGEAYMDSWWDVDDLEAFFFRVMRSDLRRRVRPLPVLLAALRRYLCNLQSMRRAWEIGKRHYDLGNDLFKAMLDRRMVYSCAYWKGACNLDEAQEAKLDLICRKIGVRAGQRVLDIGCGFGGFCKFTAEHYGASCVGVTVSREQAEYARRACAGLPVEIRLEDYRELQGDECFDHVVSVGMFEHVGRRNYRTFMKVVHRVLRRGGVFLLQTIGSSNLGGGDAWLAKYIFPNSFVPSQSQVAAAARGLFVLEDWHNFGNDYHRTLLAWHGNFVRGWEHLREKYGERFFRMWQFYLLSSAGNFHARTIQLWQIVFSKGGVVSGYTSQR